MRVVRTKAIKNLTREARTCFYLYMGKRIEDEQLGQKDDTLGVAAIRYIIARSESTKSETTRIKISKCLGRVIEMAALARTANSWANEVNLVRNWFLRKSDRKKSEFKDYISLMTQLVPFVKKQNLLLAADMLTCYRGEVECYELYEGESLLVGAALVEIARIAQGKKYYELAADIMGRATSKPWPKDHSFNLAREVDDIESRFGLAEKLGKHGAFLVGNPGKTKRPLIDRSI